MEKVISEWRVVETDDGFRVEIKGDKEALRGWLKHCRHHGPMGGHAHGMRHGPRGMRFAMWGPGCGSHGPWGPGFADEGPCCSEDDESEEEPEEHEG